jgi:hypothetical protein
MTEPSCLPHRRDPERLATHAQGCDDCAAYQRELERFDHAVTPPVEGEPLLLNPGELPVAPWEGAAHRSWPLLAVAALLAAIVAGLLFASAGIGVIEGVRGTLQAMARGNMLRLAAAFGESVREAPMPFHGLIFGAFLGINFILFRLLRRAPRGADARTR